jgi:hypothetical protein
MKRVLLFFVVFLATTMAMGQIKVATKRKEANNE